jgi:ketosteroid isomerase-like protein
MPHENVEIVRGWVQAVISGDVEKALEGLDPEIVVRVHDLPDVPEYHGPEGVAQWRADWESSWESWTWEPQDFVSKGDLVVAALLTVAKGHTSGVEVRRLTGAVFRLRDGKAIELDYYASNREALEAVGLSHYARS